MSTTPNDAGLTPVSVDPHLFLRGLRQCHRTQDFDRGGHSIWSPFQLQATVLDSDLDSGWLMCYPCFSHHVCIGSCDFVLQAAITVITLTLTALNMSITTFPRPPASGPLHHQRDRDFLAS